MKHKVKRVHFVGIGGAGMSGIAEVLLTQGYQVTGSDLAPGAATRRLTGLGARVVFCHVGDKGHAFGFDAAGGVCRTQRVQVAFAGLVRDDRARRRRKKCERGGHALV